MLYRVTTKNNNDEKILIEDVIKSHELLITGYDKKVGTKFRGSMSKREFLINSCKLNTIARIEKIGPSSFRIEWLGIGASNARMHNDVLEFGGSSKLAKHFDRLANLYDHVGDFIRPRVYRRYAKKSRRDNSFKKCWNILKNYLETKSIDNNLDKLEITECFKYMRDNERNFICMPLPKNKSEYITYFSIIGIMILAMGLGSYSLILTGAYFLNTIFVGGCTALTCRFFERLAKHMTELKRKMFGECLEKLNGELDTEYLGSLDTPLIERKFEFILLLKKSMKRVSGYTKEEFGEDDFYALALNYSTDRHKELGNSNKIVDPYSYINLLLNILENKFASNKKFGVMSVVPSINLEYMYEVFTSLGHTKEELDRDDFTKKICELISEVVTNAYEGCEIEIIEFIKIAVDYVSSKTGGSIDESELEAAVQNVYLAFQHKYKEAKRLDEMVKVYDHEDEIESLKGKDKTISLKQKKKEG